MGRLSEGDLVHPDIDDIAFYVSRVKNLGHRHRDKLRVSLSKIYCQRFGMDALPKTLKQFLDKDFTMEICYDECFWREVGLPYEDANENLPVVRDAIRLWYYEQLLETQ